MSRMRTLRHRPRQVPTSTEPALGLQISETEKQATGRHAQEKDGTMSSLESLCEDIRTNVTVWKRYRDKGGSDPSWSDGDNMNLCRNHIIDDRRRIEEIIARDGIEPPADLFSRLDNEFHFTLDAASSESNHKCSKYYTAGNSAFNHEWGGDGILQSAIWQGNLGMGAQVQHGSQPQRHPRRHAAAGSHGYPLVPTVHSRPCGGQVPQRATAVRSERHTGRAGTISKHDRRNAHRGKIKEGSDKWLGADTCNW